MSRRIGRGASGPLELELDAEQRGQPVEAARGAEEPDGAAAVLDLARHLGDREHTAVVDEAQLVELEHELALGRRARGEQAAKVPRAEAVDLAGQTQALAPGE